MMRDIFRVIIAIFFVLSPLSCTVDDEYLEGKACSQANGNRDCIKGYECQCENLVNTNSCICRQIKQTSSTQTDLSTSTPPNG